MRGFRITINDDEFCEADNLTAFTMVVEDRSREEQRVSLHAQAGDSPVQWLAAHLKVGDVVKIEVVDFAAEAEGNEPALACGFCGRDPHAVSHLLTGPKASICDKCLQSFSIALSTSGSLPVGAAFRDEPQWECGFCSRPATAVDGLVVRNASAICPECLSACKDLIQDAPRHGQ